MFWRYSFFISTKLTLIFWKCLSIEALSKDLYPYVRRFNSKLLRYITFSSSMLRSRRLVDGLGQSRRQQTSVVWKTLSIFLCSQTPFRTRWVFACEARRRCVSEEVLSQQRASSHCRVSDQGQLLCNGPNENMYTSSLDLPLRCKAWKLSLEGWFPQWEIHQLQIEITDAKPKDCFLESRRRISKDYLCC